MAQEIAAGKKKKPKKPTEFPEITASLFGKVG